MNKDRLFVFGDSWASNYLSNDINDIPSESSKFAFRGRFIGSKDVKKYAHDCNYYGHWIDHMREFYEVISYAQAGACNEQIIYQLGNLPQYKKGDRFIMILTDISRYSWVYDSKIYNFVPELELAAKSMYDNKHMQRVLSEQHIERTLLWESDGITNEMKFINSIPYVYEKWNPIIITWYKHMYDIMMNNNLTNIHLIDIDYKLTNISRESAQECNDLHLGVSGNYELFKRLSSKLGLDISGYNYIPKKYNNKLI